MTVDVLQEYQTLLQALVDLRSEDYEMDILSGYYDIIRDTQAEQWQALVESYLAFHRRINTSLPDPADTGIARHIHLTFGLNTLQQEVFVQPHLTLNTGIPDLIFQQDTTPALRDDHSCLVAGEYQIRAKSCFRLYIDWEQFVFTVSLKKLAGPMRRRLYLLESQEEQTYRPEAEEDKTIYGVEHLALKRRLQAKFRDQPPYFEFPHTLLLLPSQLQSAVFYPKA